MRMREPGSEVQKMNEASRGQVWACVNCKRERIWGSAKIGDEGKTSRLQCASCGRDTIHIYLRHTFQSLYENPNRFTISVSE
jgi:hypothetical protein